MHNINSRYVGCGNKSFTFKRFCVSEIHLFHVERIKKNILSLVDIEHRFDPVCSRCPWGLNFGNNISLPFDKLLQSVLKCVSQVSSCIFKYALCTCCAISFPHSIILSCGGISMAFTFWPLSWLSYRSVTLSRVISALVRAIKKDPRAPFLKKTAVHLNWIMMMFMMTMIILFFWRERDKPQ